MTDFLHMFTQKRPPYGDQNGAGPTSGNAVVKNKYCIDRWQEVYSTVFNICREVHKKGYNSKETLDALYHATDECIRYKTNGFFFEV